MDVQDITKGKYEDDSTLVGVRTGCCVARRNRRTNIKVTAQHQIDTVEYRQNLPTRLEQIESERAAAQEAILTDKRAVARKYNKRVHVKQFENGWQKIEFEDVPSYCRHCWHVGHSESMCHVHNPELKDSSDKRNVIAAPSSSWQYVPKQRQPAPGVPKIADTGGHQAALLPHNLDKSVASDVAIAAPEVATSVKEPILDSEAVPENTRPKDDAAVHVNDPSPSTNASSPSMKEPLLVSEAAVREVSDRVAMTPIIVAQDAPGILTQQPSERSPIGDAYSVLLEQEVGFPAKPVEFVEDNRRQNMILEVAI